MPFDLDRKTPPPVRTAVVAPACLSLFNKLRMPNIEATRLHDSFIGVTVLGAKVAQPTFYMFPCFLQAFEDVSGGVISSGKNVSLKDGLAAFYGHNNVVYVEPQSYDNPSYDGRSHIACRQLINQHHNQGINGAVTDDDIIGWGLKPCVVDGPVGPFRTHWILRYGSSRNLSRAEGSKFLARNPATQRADESDEAFRNRKDFRAQRDSRDMPKAWTAWVRDVLKMRLGLVQDVATEGTYAREGHAGPFLEVSGGKLSRTNILAYKT